jgi:catechol 2,3-dioxygenase-like lactoylglutathione lyase family enzyme
MNLNQVTLPAAELAPAIEFYRRLRLRLIVEDLPHYARFECPDGDSTLSLEQTPELIGGRGQSCTSSVRTSTRPLRGFWRRASSSTVCPPTSRGSGARPASAIPQVTRYASSGRAAIGATRPGG